MLLPTSLSGRYARYKDDTSTFATWLQHAAMTCGYTTDKVKSRKSLKQKASSPPKMSYPVDRLISQANAVAQCAKVHVQVPENVLHAAERAIAARQQFSEHFQQLDITNASNATHVHFINVLEESLRVLKPLCRPESTTASATADRDVKENTPLANRFEALQVDEVDQKADSSPDDHILRTEITPSTPVVDLLDDADRSEQVKIDQTLRILALLRTCMSVPMTPFTRWRMPHYPDIGVFIKTIWRQYRDDALDLSVCSIITNAAIVLVKYESQQLAEDLGIDPQASYTGFMELLKCLTSEKSVSSMQDMLDTPLGHFTFVEIAMTMEEYLNTMDDKLMSRTFPLIPSLRWVPDNEEFLSSHPILYNKMERQRMLAYMMLNFGARERVVRGTPSGHARQNGQIGTEGLMTAIGSGIVDGMISTHAVLAAKILLDIDILLGSEFNRPFTDLCSLAVASRKTMHHTLITSPIRSGPQWGPEDRALIESIDYALAQIEQLRGWSVEQSVMRNPAFRGMQMMNMELLLEDAGVRLANYHSSLLMLSYLYNALNQKDMLNVKWPELDTAIAAHQDSLFFGSLPKTPKDIAMRFTLRLGLPLTAYLDLDPKYLKDPKPGQNMTKVMKGVAHHIVTIADKDAAKEVKMSKHAARDLGPVKFLTKLQEWLLHNRQYAKIDYVRLTRDCHNLMEEIIASKQIKGRYDGDMEYLLSATDRKRLEDDRNNVPGAPTTHTLRYVDLLNKILVVDKERTEYPREFEVADRIGMSDGCDLGKASHFMRRFIEAKLASAF